MTETHNSTDQQDDNFAPVFYDLKCVRMRYYATRNPDENKPVSFQDAITIQDIPTNDTMIPIDKLTYEKFSTMGNIFYENGSFVQHIPAPPPLKDQAATALSQARTTVYQNYGMLNEPTPQSWVDYLKKLAAISNGTDTTSTELPAAPSDPTT